MTSVDREDLWHVRNCEVIVVAKHLPDTVQILVQLRSVSMELMALTKPTEI